MLASMLRVRRSPQQHEPAPPTARAPRAPLSRKTYIVRTFRFKSLTEVTVKIGSKYGLVVYNWTYRSVFRKVVFTLTDSLVYPGVNFKGWLILI